MPEKLSRDEAANRTRISNREGQRRKSGALVRSSLSSYIPSDRKKIFLELNGGIQAVELKLGQMKLLPATIIRLNYLEGLSVKEVASQTGYTLSYVHRIKKQALGRFKVC